ncbi:phosphoglycerate mutase [Coprinopsis marcescibilis]|uniref:Phosphoglycerate mutase n=1 Tax=Coprinopsis marcescibilis TaxID=230819 RepID=A0A5C3L1E0_COPMA|nr:phosphoglycerate mutase [Coprinopsis marcescibilis]
MITVTFIRHGESEDNPHNIWAGWKNAPLSSLGRQQASALAGSFAGIPFTHIYTSDLLRAHDTAKAVHDSLREPKPPFTITTSVREQHFGVAEGGVWQLDVPQDTTREELYKRGIYPIQRGRDERFEGGESLNDLARRSEMALREIVLPHLSSLEPDQVKHIAIASHGLAISELLAAILRLDPHSDKTKSYQGLLNTAWARVQVRIRDGIVGIVDRDNVPPLEVTVTHFNQSKHLENLSPEKIVEEDVSNEARAFFGGALGGENIGSDLSVSTTNADVEVGIRGNL